MKCSEYVKERGMKSLSLFSEISGVQIRTLQNWYDHNRKQFDCILAGAILANTIEINQMVEGCELTLFVGKWLEKVAYAKHE